MTKNQDSALPTQARRSTSVVSTVRPRAARDDPDGAHGRYSALVAQIVSFARAVEAEHAASR